MPVLAYIVRHGATDKSPAPEWQTQVPINDLGKAQARVAAEWLKQNAKRRPGWGVSSDLARSEQTLAICSGQIW